MSGWRSAHVVLALLVLLLDAVAHKSRVRAGPTLETFGDPIGTGGLTARASSSSGFAAYFNPTRLFDAPEGLDVGTVMLRRDLRVRLMPRPQDGKADVPDGVGSYVQSDLGDLPGRPLATSALEGTQESTGFAPHPRGAKNGVRRTSGYVAISVVKHLVPKRVVLGAGALVPMRGLLDSTANFRDEREQFFSNSLSSEFYGDRLGVASVVAGLGVRAMPRLLLGASLSLMLSNTATARSYVASAAELEDAEINIGVRAKPQLSPHFGASYQVHPRIVLSATGHGKEQLDVRSSFTNLLSTGSEARAQRQFVFGYVPARAAASALVRLHGDAQSRREWALAASAEYAHFRAYRDTHGERPDRFYRFRDVISPALGLKLRTHRLHSFFDCAVAPTPVPPQTGRSNYVDSTRYSLGLGSELRIEGFGQKYRVGIQGQLSVLPNRLQRKRTSPAAGNGANSLVRDEVPDDALDAGQGYEPAASAEGLQTNNPGYPGFSSRGRMASVSVYAGIAF
jgi:long-chain fatty acid transport protein